MSLIIREYPLQATTQQEIAMAQAARILKVAVVGTTPTLFVLEDPSLWIQATAPRLILLYETNETGSFNPTHVQYLGSIASDGLALHCFESTALIV